MKQQVNYIISELRGFFPEEELRELAYWIIEETTGMTRTQILTDCKGTQNIPNIEIILQKLRAHVPIQYIFGHTEWMGLDLRVTPATLIPRPETAELVEWVLQMADRNKPLKVLDIGTGSGCIALALKKAAPNWDVTGLDISEDALKVAKENAGRNNAEVHWLQADILSPHCPVASSPHHLHFDIIVSNPPYFQDSLKNPNAQRATARHTDTLHFAELIAHAVRLLKKDGILALVLPFEAQEEILSLAYTHGLHPTHITHVHSKPGKPAKRLLIALSPIAENSYPIPNILHIESENSPRSKEYTELTRDFYL